MTVNLDTPNTDSSTTESSDGAITEAQLAVTADQVAEYLSSHDDFFEHNTDLLLSLKLPHKHKNSISLFEKQTDLMRDRETRHHRQITSLIETAKRNDRLLNHTRELVIHLLKADNLQQVVEQTELCFVEQFGMDFATLTILSDMKPEQREVVNGLIRARKPVLGILRQEELNCLFPDHANAIGSAAVYCLRGEKELGLLAIGQKDPDYFHNNMDNLFLVFVGDILVQLFEKYSLD